MLCRIGEQGGGGCSNRRSAVGHVLLQLDFSNAYNTLSRTAMLAAVARTCPQFLPYATACYGNPATLFGSGFTLFSEEGEHQGCPCGPLFFAAATIHIAKGADEHCLGWSHWYLDDGYITGPRVTVNNVLQTVEAQARAIGLVLNRSKCGLYIKDSIPDHLFYGIPRTTSSGCMTILGCPVGELQSSKDWVTANILAPYKRALGRLEGLGDPRAAHWYSDNVCPHANLHGSCAQLNQQ